MAISSPLLETSIESARGVILSIIGSDDIGLDEVETAAGMVQQAAHPDAHIIFGASIDEDLDDEIRVVVIATGFDKIPIRQSAQRIPRAAQARMQAHAQSLRTVQSRLRMIRLKPLCRFSITRICDDARPFCGQTLT